MENAHRRIRFGQRVRAHDLDMRREEVVKHHERAIYDPYELSELLKWQEFFNFDKNALDFYERLDRTQTRSSKARRRISGT
jgi:hypothetical protein